MNLVNQDTSTHYSLVLGLYHIVFSVLGICLAADNDSTQFTWISHLSSIGVEILSSSEEEETTIRSATSIFDFDAYDIERRRISLSSYRYRQIVKCQRVNMG